MQLSGVFERSARGWNRQGISFTRCKVSGGSGAERDAHAASSPCACFCLWCSEVQNQTEFSSHFCSNFLPLMGAFETRPLIAALLDYAFISYRLGFVFVLFADPVADKTRAALVRHRRRNEGRSSEVTPAPAPPPRLLFVTCWLARCLLCSPNDPVFFFSSIWPIRLHILSNEVCLPNSGYIEKLLRGGKTPSWTGKYCFCESLK